MITSPIIAWKIDPDFFSFDRDSCYSESVYVFREETRNIVRVARYSLNYHANQITGTYQASFLIFQNQEKIDRKETGRTVNMETENKGNSLKLKVNESHHLSGINSDDVTYHAYFDPFLQQGLSTTIDIFKLPGNRIAVGQDIRPRALCSDPGRVAYPVN